VIVLVDSPVQDFITKKKSWECQVPDTEVAGGAKDMGGPKVGRQKG
jgi:hypothetical protein